MTVIRNFAESQPIIRQALKDKRLGFQTKARVSEGCYMRYRDGGCCAFGALFSAEQLRDFYRNNGSSIVSLSLFRNALASDNPDWLVKVQDTHDLLIDAIAARRHECADEYYREFLTLIDWQVERDGEPPRLPL